MDFEGRTVLVTGGAGFIGSHLVERLLEFDCDVVLADDFSRGSLDNVAHLLDDVEVVPVDLTTPAGCHRSTEGVDDVFHLAARVGGNHYIQRENVGGLTPSVLRNQHLLEVARVNDIDRFLFASCTCVYRQEHNDLNPLQRGAGDSRKPPQLLRVGEGSRRNSLFRPITRTTASTVSWCGSSTRTAPGRASIRTAVTSSRRCVAK